MCSYNFIPIKCKIKLFLQLSKNKKSIKRENVFVYVNYIANSTAKSPIIIVITYKM